MADEYVVRPINKLLFYFKKNGRHEEKLTCEEILINNLNESGSVSLDQISKI